MNEPKPYPPIVTPDTTPLLSGKYLHPHIIGNIYANPPDIPTIIQQTAMNPPISYINDIIKKANAIEEEQIPIVTLNPILSAIFIPNDKHDIVIKPKIGNMMAI